MSDNQDRSFERIDSMTTEELEEMLRLDANAPEDQESDEELIFYVMGVLADRKRNEYTEDTAQKALDSFRKHYMPVSENGDSIQRNPQRKFIPWVRRLTAVAASLVLVLGISISVNAFSFKELWNVFSRWTQETFCFVVGEDTQITEPSPNRRDDCMELRELLAKNNHDPGIVPSWIPDGFELKVVEQDLSPVQERYEAYYLCENRSLTIFILSYLEEDPPQAEVSENLIEIYESNGLQFYLFMNNNQLCALWIKDQYQCYMSGNISVEELKIMIDSIGKG